MRVIVILFAVGFLGISCGVHKTVSKEEKTEENREGERKVQEEKSFFELVQSGDLDEMKERGFSGESMNQVNEEGQSLLMMALIWNQKDIMLYLLEQGVDLTLKDKEGKDIFDYKPLNEELGQVLEAWIQKDENQNLFMLAVEKGNYKQVNRFLELGVDPNLRYEEDGATPLIRAVQHANPKDRERYSQYMRVVRVLLKLDNSRGFEYGTDIHLRDHFGKSALSYAQDNSDLRLVRALKNFGA